MQPIEIRVTYPHHRAGEWGLVTGLVWDAGRPCFVVAWPHKPGDERPTTERWIADHPIASYEFRPYSPPTQLDT